MLAYIQFIIWYNQNVGKLIALWFLNSQSKPLTWIRTLVGLMVYSFSPGFTFIVEINNIFLAYINSICSYFVCMGQTVLRTAVGHRTVAPASHSSVPYQIASHKLMANKMINICILSPLRYIM